MAVHQETIDVAQRAAAAIDEKKGIDIAVLDVSVLLVITDLFLICSGSSRRHVLTLAEEVEAAIKQDGRKPLRREGMEDGQWVLLDYGDVVVHVFDPETRAYYDLERLWADADRLAMEVAAGSQ